MAGIKYLGVTGLNELITLLKNDLSKKNDLFQFVTLPNYLEYLGKIVQYTGETTDAYKRGTFYYSTGTAWVALDNNGGEVDLSNIIAKGVNTTTFPTWNEAVPGAIYYTYDTVNKLVKMYMKDINNVDQFIEVGATGTGTETEGTLNFNELDNVPTINGKPLKNVLAEAATQLILESSVKHYVNDVWTEEIANVDDIRFEAIKDERIIEIARSED